MNQLVAAQQFSTEGRPLKFIAVIRMSSIGDIIMTYAAIDSLVAKGFTPILVCDSKFFGATDCLLQLRWSATHSQETGIRLLRRGSEQELWSELKTLDTNANEVWKCVEGILDLQCTSRSARILPLLQRKIEQQAGRKAPVVRVHKNTLQRTWLVCKAFFVSLFSRPKFLPNPLVTSIKQLSPLNKANESSSLIQMKKGFVAHAAQGKGVVDLHLKAVEKLVSQLPNAQLGSRSTISASLSTHIFSDANHEYVCIFPGASFPSKQWPKEHFRKLLELIHKETSWKVTLCGGKGEESLGNFLSGFQNTTNSIGKLSLSESIRCLQGALGFVSNDSFPGHAADALGLPGVVLFGPTSPSLGFQPHSAQIRSLWAGLSCSPCNRHGSLPCRYRDLACLTHISAEEVFHNLRLAIGSRQI